MQDGVDRSRHVDEVRHVVVLERERRPSEEVVEVAKGAGDEVVDGDDLVAAGQQRLAEVRTEEAGTAGDDDPSSGHGRPRPS